MDVNEELEAGTQRKGWLINMLPSTRKVELDSVATERACLELFFLCEHGQGRFSTFVIYEPYFYVLCRPGTHKLAKSALEKKFEKDLLSIETVDLEDLDQLNHLSFKRQGNGVLKLMFRTVNDMMQVRRVLLPLVKKNQSSSKSLEAYSTVAALEPTASTSASGNGFFRSRKPLQLSCEDDIELVPKAAVQMAASADPMQNLIDLREFDVPYYQRVCIDLGLNAGCWFMVKWDMNRGSICTKMMDCLDQKAEPVVLAFDLECTKQPLKFPDPAFDEIYMISYMVDRNGFLLINRAHVSDNVSDFEYTPKAEFPGPFEVVNLENEKEVLQHFFRHCNELKPTVYVTYNGDSFDFPFLEVRSTKHGINMKDEIGVSRVQSSTQSFEQQQQQQKKNKPAAEQQEDNEDDEDDDATGGISVLGGGEYRGRWSVHMDCLYWVKRDSYLPAGSRSLKAVTKAKLGYDPVEVDPEEMMNLARDKPNHMAAYSVSDAVSTFYLFDKYVNLFIFSLCTIIPLGAEDVLRKGSGTLCESLLMVEAFQKHIICPNKQMDDMEKFYNGHLLESETYVGGHVECLESGVFREDVPIQFDLDPQGFATLRSKIDRDLRFAIEVEGGNKVEDCVNFDSIKQQIDTCLEEMEQNYKRFESPLIYHLDVGAMYPNIILTNRLQPCAIVDDVICASCDFNRADSNCKREMKWDWRGEMFPASKSEYNQLVSQLQYETFDGQSFRDLPKQEKHGKIKSWLKAYCQKTFRRVKDTVVEQRKATICMRENPFYVDTVRAFRDRRNEYKKHNKHWGKKAKEFPAGSLERMECETKVLLYDSLQLAHKCILNSFYGYVMRKGARWHSMEMAAVVTKTGSDLIKQARILVEQVGKPLELDTDGIWCVFPKSFPDAFQFEFKDKSKQYISYPCVMLNSDVHDAFTNHQYQTLQPDGKEYVTNSECSIFFELDGPYRCMVLPASQEEGKLLKKRYAVFNRNGTIAELKGFELKRRGELKIIKIFQAQVFERFLNGTNLEECYQAVGEIANFWLDVLYTKGRDLTDEEVIDLISENRSMSKSLAEYGEQKSTSITTAKRLAEFLGGDMVRDKGLACKLLVSSKPYGSPTTERAIPTLIFSASKEVRHSCLKKWLKDNSLPMDLDVREVIDWQYYIDRLGKAIQKIITIPAALQRVANPVPRVKHPEWLARRVREKFDGFTQLKIDSLFTRKDKSTAIIVEEEEEEEMKKEVVETPQQQMVVSAEPFQDWLATRKSLWKERRNGGAGLKRNKRSLGESSAAGAAGAQEPISMARFVQQDQQQLAQQILQLVEIRETASDPGVLSLVVGGIGPEAQAFRTIRVVMPRIVYMDSSNEGEELEVPLPAAVLSRTRVTNKFLPQARPFHNLFRLEIDEAQYHMDGKDVTNFLTRPEVLGVYEMNISLTRRALAELELFVRRDPTSNNNKRGNAPLPYSSISSHRQVTSAYLADSTYSRAFLYHAGTAKRQVFALFFVKEDQHIEDIVVPKHASKAYMWFVGKSADSVNVDKLMTEALRENGLDQVGIVDTPPCKVQISDDLMQCWKDVREVLQQQIRKHNKRLLLLLQSIAGKERAIELLGGLESTPCIEILPDHAAALTCFPAVLWTRTACLQALKKYLVHANWFYARLQSSRFGKLPIAHMGEDHLIQVSDIVLARSLTHNNMVSWASPCPPDLGGIQNDDVSHLIVQSEFENPYVLNSAAYRQVCVEIDVSNLAMGALLNADKITEIDTALGASGMDLAWLESSAAISARDGKWSVSYGDCTRAFKLLRGIANNWFMETLDEALPERDRRMAYALLGQAYRWVSSTKSQLRDPSIHRMMHALMSKLFFRLIAEFKRLGGGIVYASFERIVVSCADRTDPHAAVDWFEHVIRTLHDMDLFQHLHFEVNQYWRQYMFLDSFNWGGIKWEYENSSTETTGEAMQVTHHWNIVNYLPKSVQDFALLMIAEFVYRPAKRALQPLTDMTAANEDEEGRHEDWACEDPAERAMIKYIRQLVSETFTRRFLEYVPLVVSQHHDFPVLPGSHLPLSNAALELTKTVCFVLTLDHRARDQVRVLKRQVLKTIHVLEFAPEAVFRMPSLELVLPDVICSNCNHCEDIDLCRDERMLVASVDEEEEAIDGGEWKCSKCQASYDKSLVESNLVEVCHRRSLAFQLQDLVCNKCRTIRSDNLSEFCACSGQWTWAQISAEEFASSLEPFARVADYHGFAWLHQVVQFALQEGEYELFHFDNNHAEADEDDEAMEEE